MTNPQHSTYRALVQNMWTDGKIIPEEVTTLTTMQSQLGISPEDAATIERDVMGQTKEEALVAGMGTNVPGSLPLDSQSAPSPGSSDVLGTFSGGRTFVSASDEQTGPRTLSGRVTSAGSDARSSRLGHLQTGDRVADRFEVLGSLGEGGMGQVLKVRDTKLDAVRAMKVVRPELLHRGDVLERFRHEVTTSQKLAHPNIVRVFDYDEDDARGIHFLTMEFVDGMTLRKWLKQKRRAKAQVSLKEFTAIAQGLCAALQYAHGFTVHRDLKPENIMLDRASRGIKLMDFGIAKAFGANKQFVTAGPMGTVYYAAPEQERGEQVDQRADIYSMGVILYEVLSGEIPRAGSKPIGEVRPDISANVTKAIETAMATSPGDRFSSVSALSEALLTSTPPLKSKPDATTTDVDSYGIADDPYHEAVGDDENISRSAPTISRESRGKLGTIHGYAEDPQLTPVPFARQLTLVVIMGLIGFFWGVKEQPLAAFEWADIWWWAYAVVTGGISIGLLVDWCRKTDRQRRHQVCIESGSPSQNDTPTHTWSRLLKVAILTLVGCAAAVALMVLVVPWLSDNWGWLLAGFLFIAWIVGNASK